MHQQKDEVEHCTKVQTLIPWLSELQWIVGVRPLNNGLKYTGGHSQLVLLWTSKHGQRQKGCVTSQTMLTVRVWHHHHQLHLSYLTFHALSDVGRHWKSAFIIWTLCVTLITSRVPVSKSKVLFFCHCCSWVLGVFFFFFFLARACCCCFLLLQWGFLLLLPFII